MGLGCPQCGSLKSNVHEAGCTWEARNPTVAVLHPVVPWRSVMAEALQCLEYVERAHPEATGGLRRSEAIRSIRALGIEPSV